MLDFVKEGDDLGAVFGDGFLDVGAVEPGEIFSSADVADAFAEAAASGDGGFAMTVVVLVEDEEVAWGAVEVVGAVFEGFLAGGDGGEVFGSDFLVDFAVGWSGRFGEDFTVLGDNVAGADRGKGKVTRRVGADGVRGRIIEGAGFSGSGTMVVEETGDDEGGLVGHEVDWEVGELTFAESDGFGELWEPGGFEMREKE